METTFRRASETGRLLNLWARIATLLLLWTGAAGKGLAQYVYVDQLDTTAIAGIPWGNVTNKAVACDGTNFLVAWADFKNGSSFLADIYAVRVSTAGRLLDSFTIEVCKMPNYQDEVAVVFDGTDFLVAWEDDRDGSTQSKIYGARVSRQGRVLDKQGYLIISHPSMECESPALACDTASGAILMVWAQGVSTAPFNLYAGRFRAGNSIAATFLLSPTSTNQSNPSVAFDGQSYMVAWEDNRNGSYDIYSARVGKTGNASLNPAGIPVSRALRDQLAPVLCAGTGRFFIVWHDLRHGGYPNFSVYGARVLADGTLEDTTAIKVADSPYSDRNPSAGFDGQRFFVVWDQGIIGNPLAGIRDSFSLRGARITPQGVLMDSAGIAINTAVPGQTLGYSDLLYAAGDFFLLWMGQQDRQGLYASAMNESGLLSLPQGLQLRISVNRQVTPEIAWDGQNFLAVWSDYRGNAGDQIWGMRMDQLGKTLDSQAIDIANLGKTARQNPAVAFNGSSYLVVWQENRDIMGLRLSKTGKRKDAAPLVIYADNGFSQERPAVASDGNNWLVLWQDQRPATGGEYDIYGARVDSAGVVLDPQGFVVSAAARGQRDPAVAFDGQQYWVSWEDDRAGFATTGIYAARVTPAGLVRDPQGMRIEEREFENLQDPALAIGAGYVCFMWLEHDKAAACRWHLNGNARDRNPIGLGNNPDIKYALRGVFDGKYFVAAIETEFAALQGGNAIELVYMDTALNYSKGYNLNYFGRHHTSPALAAGPAGFTALAMSVYVPEHKGRRYESERIWGGVFGGPPTGLAALQSPVVLMVYPNPFAGQLTFVFELQSASNVEITLFDGMGRRLALLTDALFPSGTHLQTYSPDPGLPDGIYLCSIRVGTQVETLRLLRLR